MTVINGGYKQYKLPNGLVVAMQNTPTQTIAGNLRVNFGAVNEQKGEEGLAHFLEHCIMAGGSKKFGPEQSKQLRENLGYVNANTSIGRISFPVNMLSEDLENWLNFVSNSALNPALESTKVEEERGRVLREIADAKSDSTFKENRAFYRALYRGHPSEIFVLGKEDVIKNVSAKKLGEFHSRGFNTNNMDLILAGALPKGAEDLVEKYFGNQPAGANTRTIFPELAPLEKRTILHTPSPELYNKEKPEESSALLYLAFLTVPDSHQDSFAVRTLSSILNKRLHDEISTKRGLAYGIGSSSGSSYNVGTALVQGKVPAIRLDESVDAIFEAMTQLRENRATQEEVDGTKRAVKYHFALSSENNEGHVSSIASLLDDGRTPEAMIEGFNAVTSEKLIEVARKYLPEGREKGKYVMTIKDPLKSE